MFMHKHTCIHAYKSYGSYIQTHAYRPQIDVTRVYVFLMHRNIRIINTHAYIHTDHTNDTDEVTDHTYTHANRPQIDQTCVFVLFIYILHSCTNTYA